jgi:hypothetical protein
VVPFAKAGNHVAGASQQKISSQCLAMISWDAEATNGQAISAWWFQHLGEYVWEYNGVYYMIVCVYIIPGMDDLQWRA